MGGDGYAWTRADASDISLFVSQSRLEAPIARWDMPDRWPTESEAASRGRLTDGMDEIFASGLEGEEKFSRSLPSGGRPASALMALS